MATIRHCRHCWGDCRGECLLDETGICIHGANSSLPWPMRARSVLSRRWWRRILWGWVPWGPRACAR